MAKAKAKKNSRILVSEDIATGAEERSRAEAVRSCATRLAARLGCGVDFVHVDDLSFYPSKTSSAKAMVDQYVSDKKTRLGQTAQVGALKSKVIFLKGVPAAKIVAHASQGGTYELIALGTHGRKGLSRLILGSVAEEIVRQSRVPVMSLGPEAVEGASTFLNAPDGSPVRILVPTGLSPNSDRAQVYALNLAKRLGAEVVLFHASREALHPVLQTAFSVPVPPQGVTQMFEEHKELTWKQLKKEAAKLSKQGIKVTPVLDSKTLSSADAVLEVARAEKVSLIVMGTHGRSMVSGAFFGRTARGVVLGSRVPVITVRSKLG